MKANSKNDFGKSLQHVRKFDRLESLRGSTTTDSYSEETFGPLSNVRFAVFALGSSAYPNFCAYGKYVDNVLGELGGERLTKVAYGDEMCGQEQAFRKWAPEVFKVISAIYEELNISFYIVNIVQIACETFCLDTDDTFSSATLALQGESLTRDTVRLVPVNDNTSLDRQLSKYHNKKAVVCKIKSKPRNLHGNTRNSSGKSTILVEIIANDVNFKS